MAAPPGPGTPSAPPEVGGPRPAATASPIAVVWCRQVDNEAESPGYTTVPEDFPGQRETLEVIRAVGHLTVNVADTHDYWDPDPSQPLSYYPNLFLYPAYGGRYICLGRMFLSTEDRPRLGMKTLVLDTAQLLASGDFGGTILRWYASMGGPRRDGARSPPIPNPGLYNILGEGFLFHRGSTDPVVVVAADEWEPAMQTILELIRLLPASLVSLGAILAFPYFLPQPKTNLHEFAEQLPLAVALMRVPRGEAAGDRHAKRMSSWESAPVTFRDLTEGIPAPKGKENVPLVLQYVRDHQEAKLLPISQRVDLVETPRLRSHLADPERQGGRDRRKEMWRIGTAMESAALLLQRARGRNVPVTAETAKRAQEYLQARLPESDVGAPAPAAPAAAAASPATPSPGQVPPWLSRPVEAAPVAPAAPSPPEVVPVSVSDDPSLLKAAPPAPLPAAPSPPPVAPRAPPPTTGPPPASPFPAARPVTPAPPPSSPLPPRPSPPSVPAPAPPTSSAAPPGRPAPPSVDPVALRQEIEREVLRILDQRLAALPRPPTPGPATALDEKLRAELDARFQSVQQQAAAQLSSAVAALEQRQGEARTGQLAQADAGIQAVQQQLAAKLASALADVERHQAQLRANDLAQAEQRQAELRAQEIAQAEVRLLAATRDDLAAVLDRRLGEAVDPKLQELGRRLDDASARLAAAQLTATGQLNAAVDAAEARIAGQREADAAALEARLAAKLQSSLTESIDARLAQRLEPRIGELSRRIDDAVSASVAKGREDARTDLTKSVEALKARITQAEEELRANLLAQLDLQMRESEERDAQARLGLDARLDSALKAHLTEADERRARELKELEQRLNLLVDGRSREALDRVGGLGTALDTRVAAVVDEKVAAAEERVRAQLDAGLNESGEARVHAIADLQVRLQSYFDQRLREEQEHERQKYLELLARMKGEVDSSLARMVDSARFDTALREKLARTLEAYRAETQRVIESRIATAEQQLKVDQTDVSAHLARFEQLLEERRGETAKLEETLRAELEDLDRRSQILADRLVPVVRKTWLRVVELQKGGGSPEADLQMNQLRREFTRELQRIEGELVERTTEIRDRMESAISNQGRVWLTLIRQLSQLSDDRRTVDKRREPRKAVPMDRADADIAESLEGIPGVYPANAADEEDPVNPLDPDPDEPTRGSPPPSPAGSDRSGRRRFRRASQ